MLVGYGRTPLLLAGYDYELKWDGYRAVALLVNGQLQWLRGRRGGKLAARFPRLGARLGAAAGADEILVDGEVIASPGDFRSFDLLYGGAGGVRSPLDVVFVAFDVLRVDGRPTIALELEERLALLAAHLVVNESVVRSRPFVDGVGLFAAAEPAGMEGVVAKRIGSRYTPGRRAARDWLKFKTAHARPAGLWSQRVS